MDVYPITSNRIGTETGTTMFLIMCAFDADGETVKRGLFFQNPFARDVDECADFATDECSHVFDVPVDAITITNIVPIVLA